MCYEVWSNIQTLGAFVPSGCSSTHIKAFTTVSTCSNRFLKSAFILYVEKKKDYLGGLQESAEEVWRDFILPLQIIFIEDEMQIKQQGHEMYHLICFGGRDFVWIRLAFKLK